MAAQRPGELDTMEELEAELRAFNAARRSTACVLPAEMTAARTAGAPAAAAGVAAARV